MKPSIPLTRFALPIPLALGITGALFFAMQFLVAERGHLVLDEREYKKVEIRKVTPLDPPVKKIRKRPETVKPPVVVTQNNPTQDPGTVLEIPVFEPPGPIVSDPLIGAGNATPFRTVQVNPPYPEGALRAGIEGYAVLQFTVAADGTVRDIVVLDENPKGWGFAAQSIRSAAKFRYQPRVVNGKKVDTPGVTERFNFVLEEDKG